MNKASQKRLFYFLAFLFAIFAPFSGAAPVAAAESLTLGVPLAVSVDWRWQHFLLKAPSDGNITVTVSAANLGDINVAMVAETTHQEMGKFQVEGGKYVLRVNGSAAANFSVGVSCRWESTVNGVTILATQVPAPGSADSEFSKTPPEIAPGGQVAGHLGFVYWNVPWDGGSYTDQKDEYALKITAPGNGRARAGADATLRYRLELRNSFGDLWKSADSSGGKAELTWDLSKDEVGKIYSLHIVLRDGYGSYGIDTLLNGAPAPSPPVTPPSASSNPFVGTWLRSEGGRIVDGITITPAANGNYQLIFRESETGEPYSQGLGQVQNNILLAVSWSPSRNLVRFIKIALQNSGEISFTSYLLDGAVSWTGRFYRKSGDAPAQTGPVPSQGAVNLAIGRPARQSSVYPGTGVDQSAHLAVDGKSSGRDPHDLMMTNNENNPWWLVDLGRIAALEQVRLFNRRNPDVATCLTIEVLLSGDGANWRKVYAHNNTRWETLNIPVSGQARFVKVQLPSYGSISLYEVEVIGQ